MKFSLIFKLAFHALFSAISCSINQTYLLVPSNFEINISLDRSAAIRSYGDLSKQKCIASCSIYEECWLINYTNDKKCYLYNSKAKNILKKLDALNTNNGLFFIRKEYIEIGNEIQHVSGLVHHWSFDGSLVDLITGKNITLKVGGSLAQINRFGIKNSALRLDKGYGEIPQDIYFEPKGFTYMIWICLSSLSTHQRIFEFGNGNDKDNIAIGINGQSASDFSVNSLTSLQFKSGSGVKYCGYQSNFKMDVWIHLAVSVGQEDSFLYENGIEIKLCPDFPSHLTSVVRNRNFIGGTAWSPNVYSSLDGKVDDLKIFNRKLTAQEIVEEMKNTGSKIFGQLLHIFTNMNLFTEGLVHYWPMAGSTNDIIGSKHITIVVNGSLTNDRFGNKKSALVVNDGKCRLPTGNYFNSPDFTFMLWVKFFSFKFYEKVLLLNTVNRRIFVIEIYHNTGRVTFTYDSLMSTTDKEVLTIGDWTHISVSKSGSKHSLFINSNEISSLTISNVDHQIEANMFLGGTENEVSNQIMDEIKIFNRALSIDEIKLEMDIGQPFDVEVY